MIAQRPGGAGWAGKQEQEKGRGKQEQEKGRGKPNPLARALASA
jgi:hypothetical protein